MNERLSERAYRLIKEKIVRLELAPSELINEQALMEDLGLGRTPIREALLQLAQEDLVNIVPRRGMFVADISITDLQKIFEVRIVLERLCARLAAQRISEEQIARMEAIHRELDAVPPGDIKALMACDTHFHDLLYEAGGNEFLADALHRLYDHSLRLWYLALDRVEDVRGQVDQHVEIVEALKRGDAALAETLTQEHIQQFQREIRAVL
jgi:DNA-binding GntR family transcriptional regulator